MDHIIKEKLNQLINKCEVLAKKGKYPECIDIMEEIVAIKKEIYGIEHSQFEKASERLCQYLNLAAMIYLQQEKLQLSLDCLKKAELVCRNSLQYKSTTYNNLACYYRRTGKIRTALTYLIQALELQIRMEEPKTLSDTHLNLCAVLSQLDRHEDALQHAMLSIILLQDEFLQVCLPHVLHQNHETPPISDQRLAVLSIAYHNLGVEFQHLKRFEQAVKIYKKALKLSREYLCDNEQLIQNLSKVVASATQQINYDKKSYNLSKQQKFERETQENKRDLYKDLSQNTERMRNMPKFRISAGKQLRSSVDQLNKNLFGTGNTGENEKFDIRNFATRKNPRYHKSFVIPQPRNDEDQVNNGFEERRRIQSDANKFNLAANT